MSDRGTISGFDDIHHDQSAVQPGTVLARPSGELVWAHAANSERCPALIQLARRMMAARADLSVLITLAPGVSPPHHGCRGIIIQPSPPDTPGAADRFLNHWKPDLCLWSVGFLQPQLISRAARLNTPLFLIDAEEKGFDDMRRRWLPDTARSVLGQFLQVYASSANAAQRLRRLGVAEANITVTGRLQDGNSALPFSQAERDELAQGLAGRPAWFAAKFQPDELSLILEAHRKASRLAHRLLLILLPENAKNASGLAEQLAQEGWQVASWAKGEMPNENTQVLVADSYDDLGLWYRIAAITFMASSLVKGTEGRDPFEPAALGSAILYGPHVKGYASTYQRLTQAGGARMVRDSDGLGQAVIRLIAPDQAANMALAAWEVASKGAEVTDRVLDLVQDSLDQRMANDAGA